MTVMARVAHCGPENDAGRAFVEHEITSGYFDIGEGDAIVYGNDSVTSLMGNGARPWHFECM